MILVLLILTAVFLGVFWDLNNDGLAKPLRIAIELVVVDEVSTTTADVDMSSGSHLCVWLEM